jgi:hypothetical protein
MGGGQIQREFAAFGAAIRNQAKVVQGNGVDIQYST